MKKGFTLLEIIIVIIIIGILATLGFTQYSRMVERSRGAECRAIAGDIRKFAAAYRLEHGVLDGSNGDPAFTNLLANIGAATDQIPVGCVPTHYFRYNMVVNNANQITTTATRCTAGGKNPQAAAANDYTLLSNFLTGIDTAGGSGNY